MPEEISVYRSPEKEAEYMVAREAAMRLWSVPYETRWVPTTLGETHITVSGPEAGDPIILLHGMGDCAAGWYANIEALAAKYRIYAVDVVTDVGKSRVSVVPRTREQFADWLKELCEGLGLESTHVAGLSYGGFLAINFAYFHPDLVRKVILLAPAGVFQKLSWLFYVQTLSAIVLPFQRRKDAMWAWMTHQRAVLENAHGAMAKLVQRVGAPKLGVPPSMFSDDELKSIQNQSLLLIGDHEVLYAPARAIQRAKQLMPDLRAELVPDCGHLVPMENPDFVNRRMLDFLAGA